MPSVVRTVTASLTAYAAGDNIGGLLPLTTLRDRVITQLTVIDASDQKVALKIYLFREAPAATITDNAAFTITEADADKLVGVIDVAALDYVDLGAIAYATIDVSRFSNVKYAVITTSGTPTYAGADDLQLTFTVES